MPVIGRKTFQRNLASLEKCSGDDNFFKWCTQLKLTCTKEECKEISVVLTWLHGHLHQDDTHKREVIEPFALAFGFTWKACDYLNVEALWFKRKVSVFSVAALHISIFTLACMKYSCVDCEALRLKEKRVPACIIGWQRRNFGMNREQKCLLEDWQHERLATRPAAKQPK
jgi:hypothetical protein